MMINRLSIQRTTVSLTPVLAVLLVNMVISVFFMPFTFISGLDALWRILLRFVHLTLNLTLPLFLLPFLASFLVGMLNRQNRHLVVMKDELHENVQLKNWLIRPFQGVGLALLFTTKILAFLQIYTGSKISSGSFLPSGHFSIDRFLIATTIAAVVSLLLSCLWALDDLGVRYSNRKTGEVRMIGRAVGLFLPIIFGIYGIFGILEDTSSLLAVQYIFQIVIVLYPPFVVFSLFHTWYVETRKGSLFDRLRINPM